MKHTVHTSNVRHARPFGLALFGAILGACAVGSGGSVASAAPVARIASIEVVGHGWGSGIGLGQWGAFGYAVRYHFGFERILDRYYGSTTSATLPAIGRTPNPTVRVIILENLNLTTNVGYDPVVTSPSAFTVTSSTGVAVPTTTVPTSTVPATTAPTTTVPATTAPTTTVPATTAPTTTVPATTVPATTAPTSTAPTTTAPTTTTAAPTTPTSLVVPAGVAVDLRLQPSGAWNAYEGSSCAAASASTAPVATGLVNPVATPANLAASATRPQLLTLCRHDGVDEPLRGQIEAYDRSGYERTLNIVPLESYLQGVVPAESSASWGLDGTTVGAPQGEPWGFQALEAQAVAARSYALAYAAAGGWNGYADICDTDACQAYVGATYETAVSNAAVTDTAGTVRVASGATYNKATIVSTRFSASSGGWTAPSTFPAVRDLGDSCVVPGNPLECNPNHTWSSVVEARVINRHFPAIGRLLRIRVTVRNHDGALGGRALEVGLTGTKGAVLVTGDALASALGLRSDWFAVAHVTRVGAPLTVPTTVPTTTVPTTTVPTSTGVFGATGVSGTTGVSGVTGVSGATGSTGVSGTTGPLAPAT